MDKDKTSFERTILLATSVLGAIGALFTALNGIFDKVKETSKIFAGFDKWQLAAATLALIVLSSWLFRLSRRRRSVLLRPEALRLGRDNPAHLIGRAQDTAQLIRLCREQSLVFLEGESGAGKSALLQAGLVPALKGDPELLPIYVESLVGADWERDPRRFLAAALWTALDEPARGALDLKVPPASDTVCAVIAAISPKLGRMPLVILDQFDDYQTRHRERFLPRKTWLKPARLCEQNVFWRDLRDLLVSATIHLVAVTRADTASGLTSVRFIEPETYRLDRLSSHFVAPLLGALAKEGGEQPVITDPEYGWTTLLTRLAADIERAGTILPQQLKIVLAGLGTLPGRVLTVAAYERVGGAGGLEARFIEDRIAKAARLHGVTEEAVRAALLGLVDAETGQQTIERRNEDLLLSIDREAPEKARLALNQLAQEEIVRRRVDPGTGESSWLLDHDYLARAVREADRRANRWQQALADGEKLLADSGDSWARWWHALLPPRIQLGFLYDRLHGRFRYGEHRLYAAKSLQRFGPIMGVIFLTAAASGYEWRSRAAEQIVKSAEGILNGLDFQQGPVVDGEALVRLASADTAVRQQALKLVLTDSDRARVFNRQPQLVVRAIAGVSPEFRTFGERLLMDAPIPNQPEISVATSNAAQLIGPEGIPVDWWLIAIKGATDPSALRALGEGLGALSAKLSDNQVQEAAEPFLSAIKLAAKNPFDLETLGEGLGALPAKLSDSQAQEAGEAFIAAIEVERNDTSALYYLKALGAGLRALPARLSDSQAKEVVESFLIAIKSTKDPSVLRLRGEGSPDGGVGGLADVMAKLSDSQEQQAVEWFLTVIKGTTNPYVLDALGRELANVISKLIDSQAKEVVQLLLAALKNTKNPVALYAIGEALAALPVKLSDGQAKDVVEPFLTAIKNTTDPGHLQALGAGLGALRVQLNDNQAKEAVEAFLAAINGATDPEALGALGAGLAAVVGEFNDRQAQEAILPFPDLIKRTTNPWAAGPLEAVLKAIAAKVDDSQAQKAVEPLLADIKNAKDPFVLSSLGTALEKLPITLSADQGKLAVESFRAAVESATGGYALGGVGTGLARFADKLDPSSAKSADTIAWRVLQRTRDRWCFASFVDLFVKLTRNEPRDQQVVRIFQLLRNPLSAPERQLTKNTDPNPTDKVTTTLLTALERAPGVQAEFGGDIWKAVEWAEAEQKAGRLKELDLNAPLQHR
jgi:hypothetical protein